MKKFIVFSDLHGDRRSLQKLLPLIKENDGGFFAGDGASDVIGLGMENLYCVRGNCDGSGQSEMVVEVEGIKILLTHGHEYGVKGGLFRLYYRAKELDVRVVIFGHTHQPLVEEQDGILFLNPGSCSQFCLEKSFIYLCIENSKVHAFLNKTTLN